MNFGNALSFIVLTLGCAFSSGLYGGIANKTDGEVVTLSGKVTNAGADAFNLQYNGKLITVEMDDYDWDKDGYKIKKGDQVVVIGRVDKDFLETKKIEAGSVYVKSLNTFFYANSADEESMPYIPFSYSLFSVLPENAHVDLTGRVVSINNRELVVNTGLRKVPLDTKSMIYNPLDNTGFTQIDLGDRVRVTGEIDDDYFEGREVVVSSISEIQ